MRGDFVGAKLTRAEREMINSLMKADGVSNVSELLRGLIRDAYAARAAQRPIVRAKRSVSLKGAKP
jgi:hypothetical protein